MRVKEHFHIGITVTTTADPECEACQLLVSIVEGEMDLILDDILTAAHERKRSRRRR